MMNTDRAIAAEESLIGSRRQRVVIAVGRHYFDGGGGAARIAWDEARFLATLGHEVWIVGSALSADAPEHEVIENVNVLRYRLNHLSRWDPRTIWQHQTSFKDIVRRHVPESVDFVHGHQPLQSHAAEQYYRHRARFGYTLHSPVVPELRASHAALSGVAGIALNAKLAVLHRYEKSVLAKAERISVLSQYSRALIRQLHGTEIAAKVELVPGWVDLDRFRVISDRERVKRQLGWPLDRPVLLTVRRLVRRMGLDRLLYAMRSSFDEGCKFHLVIGGSGPMRESLQLLTEKLDVSEYVTFAGYVQDEQLSLVYGACDAFVLPTTELECFGLIAIEALACGRPVLATPVGAIPELLTRFEPAWLASSSDESAIAALLIGFLAQKTPPHAPEELRLIVEKNYSAATLLPRLAQTFDMQEH
jgi:glycosyltransferase involved in cell wall biosynthesis